MLVKISDIQIPERFRCDYGDLEELAKSIEKFGLLQPIVVSADSGNFVLVAGARRLLACTQLKNEEIEVRIFENLDTVTRREIELEENLKRKQFTWQEEVRAKAELVELRQLGAKKGFWSTDAKVGAEVAKELGESEATVSQDVQLAKAMEEYPELAEEESKTKAFKKYKQILKTEAYNAIASSLSGGENLWMYHGDAREELLKIPKETVGLVITDPPWGVDVFRISEQTNNTEFDDSEENAFKTLEDVLPLIFDCMKQDSHAYFFFGTKFYTRTFMLLSKLFSVQPIPLIWVKPSTFNATPLARYAPNYETIFLCHKGKRNLFRPCPAAMSFPTPTNKIHATQKPLELMKVLIENSSFKNEIVLDPFAGSGVVAKAALELERKVIVIEKDLNIFNAMKVYIHRKEEENVEDRSDVE